MSQSGKYTAGSGSSSVATLTGNSGGAVGPSGGGNINIIGSGSVVVTGNPGTNTLTISDSGGGGGIATLTGDSGSASGTSVAIAGGANITTSATGATLTVDLDPKIDLPATNVAQTEGIITIGGINMINAFGSDNAFFGGGGNTTLSTASGNYCLGKDSLTSLTTGLGNCALGGGTLNACDTGQGNVAMGVVSLVACTSGQGNTAVGAAVLGSCTTGQGNVGIGPQSLNTIVDGSNNVGIGALAGSAYSANDSNNIAIGNVGVAGENDTIRIGSTQTSFFASGIYGTAVGTPQVVLTDSNNMLGASAGTNGQVLIGATGSGVSWGNITAGSNISVTNGPNSITIASTAATGISTLAGDSGTATGTTVIIAGGSNITTSASGSTVTVDLDNNVSVSGTIFAGGTITADDGFIANTNGLDVLAGNIVFPTTTTGLVDGAILQNGAGLLHTYGTENTFLGYASGNGTNSSADNTGIGVSALNVINDAKFCTAVGHSSQMSNDSADNNTSIGYASLSLIQSANGFANSAVGSQSLTALKEGNSNSALGERSLLSITTGSYNSALGIEAGKSLDGGDSSNICIGNSGVAGDNNRIRIGTDGSGNAQQNSCFIAGIRGVTPATSVEMVVIGTDGELGSQAVPGGGSITWSEVTGTSQAMAVSNGYILNNAALVTATLPATAAVGDVMEIVGKGAGGWRLAQNAGQTVHFGNQNTTTGAGGSLSSTNRYDCIAIICTTANTDFVIKSSIGNLTVV